MGGRQASPQEIPGLLFVGTVVPAEMRFFKRVLAGARVNGYTRLVEPASGALAMSHLAVQVGWQPEQIEASDVSFISEAMGRHIAGDRIDHLEIEADGYDHLDLGDPATALYVHGLLRTEKKATSIFWQEIARAMVFAQEKHIEHIREQLDRAKGLLHGMEYRPRDMWEHMESVMDDPHTYIILNPPTITRGFEKFYDTGGRFVWKETPYTMFDVEEGYARIKQIMDASKALFTVYTERESGQKLGASPFARSGVLKSTTDEGIMRSVSVYISTNRPDEVEAFNGGRTVVQWPGHAMEPLNMRILPVDYELTQESKVAVAPITGANALYYRTLWTHNFVGHAGTDIALAVTVDDYIVGVIGYVNQLMHQRKFRGDNTDCSLLYGMARPFKMRLGRLLTRIAICKDTLALVLTAGQQVIVTGVQTSQLSRHPESKEMRGMMRLKSKSKDGKHGYKLVYQTEATDDAWQESYESWYKDELRYQHARATENDGRLRV
jgi:hypothetical protein